MRLFLSYSTPDLQHARRVKEALEARRPDLDIYMAPQRNAAGGYWMPILGEELAAADVVLLLVGKRVGPWQELEYYEALRLWRRSTPQRPLIAPVVLADNVPGLYFLDHFHCLFLNQHPFDPLVEALLASFEGVATGDRTPLWRATNPYAGLEAMGTEDAAFFFGREALTDEVLELIRTRPDRILALVGNSGVGKSSVALAGVIASLRSRLWPGDLERTWPADLADSPRWLPIVFAPGERPLKALASAFARTWLDDPAEAEAQALKWVKNFRNGSDLSALADSARAKIAEDAETNAPPRFLIYVDQCEELYSRATPENRTDEEAPHGRQQHRRPDAKLFSTLLGEAVALPEFVVLTSLRSDYYGRLQADTALFAASERIDVPPLGRAGIENVVRKPAARLGAQFDNPAVVPLIAEATAREPGALPMLSFLMADAWEEMRRDPAADGALRFPFEIVDVSRPLAERAERFYEIHPTRQAAIRRLFTLHLAHVPKEGESVRRRARRSECGADEWEVAENLTRREWRLLSSGDGDDGEPFVAVAHEALLRNWPRLGVWLDDAREFLSWKGQLELACREWEAAPGDRKGGALLMGLALEKAHRWLDERGKDLAQKDRAFIEESIAHDTARRRREERQQRLVFWGSAAAAVALAVVASVAGWQWRDASAARDVAVEEAERARDNEVAALAALSSAERQQGRPVAAVKLALAAWPRHDGDAPIPNSVARLTMKAMGAAMLRLHERLRIDAGSTINSVAFSPDGARLATGSHDDTARLWDATSSGEIARLEHDGWVTSVAFSPDGARLATGSHDDTARLWDATSSEEIARLEHDGWVTSVAFSPDGARLATGSHDDMARVWDATSREEIARLEHDSWVTSVAFSPDGAHLATGSQDGTTRLWDAVSGAEIARLEEHGDQVTSVAFSPDGARLATGSDDGTARVWDTASGAEVARLDGHGDEVRSVAFSPDGARLATGSDDATARLWDIASAAEIARLEGHGSNVNSVAFSPDGARLASGSLDDTARLWDVSAGAELVRLEGQSGGVRSVAFSPDGARVATGSDDSTARLWDTDRGAEIARLDGHGGPVSSAAFSPDGARLATGSTDGTARLWGGATWEEKVRLGGRGDQILSVAFSPDGAHLATGSGGGAARVWDAASGEEIVSLNGHSDAVNGIAFSPDGAHLATGSGWIVSEDNDNTARLWDTVSGVEIHLLEAHVLRVSSVAFSPDGALLATGSDDSMSRLWYTASGAEVVRLEGHSDRVTSVAFSPDGARLATGSDDGTARVWDTASGAEIALLEGHGNDVNSVAFSPDGARLATGSDDRTARVWRLTFDPYVETLRIGIPPGDIFRIACTWLPWVDGKPDHDLTDIAKEYGIVIDRPICNYEDGYDPPLPAWMTGETDRETSFQEPAEP